MLGRCTSVDVSGVCTDGAESDLDAWALAVTVASIVERLLADGRLVLDAWPIAVVVALVVAAVASAAVGLPCRRRAGALLGRLAQSDRRLAEELKALEGERRARRELEGVVASLREQLAKAQGQLAGQRKPAAPAVREQPRRDRYDDLFGSGPVIEGTLARREAERLLEAVREIEALMKGRVGPSQLAAADGPAWWRYVESKGVSHAIDLVAAYRNDLIDFANALEAIVRRQPDLEFRLRRIVGDVGLVAGLLNIAGGYVRTMERLNDGQNYKAAVLEMALGKPFQALVQAQSALQEWMRLFVERRALAARQEVAAFA